MIENEHVIVVMTKPITMNYRVGDNPVLLQELMKRINSEDCSAHAGRMFSKKNGGLPRDVLKKIYEGHKENEKKYNGILDYFSGTEALVWRVTPKSKLNENEFQRWLGYFTLDVIGVTNPHEAVKGSHRRFVADTVPGYNFRGFTYNGKLYSYDNGTHRSDSIKAAIRERKILGL